MAFCTNALNSSRVTGPIFLRVSSRGNSSFRTVFTATVYQKSGKFEVPRGLLLSLGCIFRTARRSRIAARTGEGRVGGEKSKNLAAGAPRGFVGDAGFALNLARRDQAAGRE